MGYLRDFINTLRKRPERSHALLSVAQSKDAIPNRVLLGNRTLRLRTEVHRAPLRVLALFIFSLMATD